MQRCCTMSQPEPFHLVSRAISYGSDSKAMVLGLADALRRNACNQPTQPKEWNWLPAAGPSGGAHDPHARLTLFNSSWPQLPPPRCQPRSDAHQGKAETWSQDQVHRIRAAVGAFERASRWLRRCRRVLFEHMHGDPRSSNTHAWGSWSRWWWWWWGWWLNPLPHGVWTCSERGWWPLNCVDRVMGFLNKVSKPHLSLSLSLSLCVSPTFLGAKNVWVVYKCLS